MPSLPPAAAQFLAAAAQRRHIPSLVPSPSFRGWTSETVIAVFTAVARFLLPRPSSVSRQRNRRRPHRPPAAPGIQSIYAAEVADAFFHWAVATCDLSHDDSTLREYARTLAACHAPVRVIFYRLRAYAGVVSTATVTAIISVCHDPASALFMYYRMKQLRCVPDTQCCNALMSVLCRSADVKAAKSLLARMELPGSRCKQDMYTYTILIDCFCKRGMDTACRKAIRRRIWEANWLYRKMIFIGLSPDVVTYNCLIDGLCKTSRVGRAHELLDEMISRGVVPNRVTYNSFVRFYSVTNEVDKGIDIIREMVRRDHGIPSSSTYTPVIHSLCESARVAEARGIFLEMVEAGHVPREYTYKLIKREIDKAGVEGLGSFTCERIEDGIKERSDSVRKVKLIMKPVTKYI